MPTAGKSGSCSPFRRSCTNDWDFSCGPCNRRSPTSELGRFVGSRSCVVQEQQQSVVPRSESAATVRGSEQRFDLIFFQIPDWPVP